VNIPSVRVYESNNVPDGGHMTENIGVYGDNTANDTKITLLYKTKVLRKKSTASKILTELQLNWMLQCGIF
jgi:hypothetical protein